MPRGKRSQINGKRVNGHGVDTREASKRKALYVVRRSEIHGRGVFAARPITKGTRIIEYKGRRISNRLANELYPDDGEGPTHTFLFELDNDIVIDAGQRGNAARWINHSCDPNCEAVEEEGRIYIEACRAIGLGEELGYDYRINLDERHSLREKRRWPCFCGAKSCRGTLLGKKR